MTERASAGDTTVAFDPQSGDIDVVAGDTTLLSGRVSATSTDGTPLSTSVSLSAAHGAVDITVTATNDTDEQRALGDICVISDAETAFSSDDRIFEHGYQSWTPTATTPLDDPFPPESVESVPQMTDVAAPDEGRTSHAVTALSGDAGSVTLGFLDHEAYLSRFDVATAPVRLTALCPGDGVSVSPGECRTAATLRVDATRTVDAALASIADAVADRMDARVPAAAPTGWCSWYHYFTEVTADDVRDNVGALDDWGVPLDVIQIDDGYEQAFGDWRTLADGFDDMRALRDDIVDAGHTAGIWLAPFYVQADSQLAADHPEWLITDGAGAPVDAGARHGPMYGLDVTHPGATEWLRETFRTVVEEWGLSTSNSTSCTPPRSRVSGTGTSPARRRTGTGWRRSERPSATRSSSAAAHRDSPAWGWSTRCASAPTRRRTGVARATPRANPPTRTRFATCSTVSSVTADCG
ncbi:alpha-galactosidase [Halobaculum marinum]|uniref:alpha-galactosidase n=1 Tax=Halobaculum marinum TaxID=3031996 RepID=UPI0023E474DF|nr:alpha-galactosidase [Halobaculum sp. DT55]